MCVGSSLDCMECPDTKHDPDIDKLIRENKMTELKNIPTNMLSRYIYLFGFDFAYYDKVIYLVENVPEQWPTIIAAAITNNCIPLLCYIISHQPDVLAYLRVEGINLAYHHHPFPKFDMIQLLLDNGCRFASNTFIDFNKQTFTGSLLSYCNSYEIPNWMLSEFLTQILANKQYLEDIIIKFINLFLEQNINLNNSNVLAICSSCCYRQALILLLEHGLDIHSNDDIALRRCGQLYRTTCLTSDILMAESEEDCLKTMQLLIDHGANVASNNNEALLLNLQLCNFSIIQLLVEHGVNIRALELVPNKLSVEHSKMIKQLLDNGLSTINICNIMAIIFHYRFSSRIISFD